MQAIRDAWAGASDTVKVAIIAAVVVVALAGLAYGLQPDWLLALLGG